MKISYSLICLTLTFVMVSSCSSPGQLTAKAKEIEVLKQKPGTECHVVGKIVGENAQGSPDLALNHARNLAVDLEANALFVNQEVPNGMVMQVHATAYRCE
jgi:hypothetical protein